MAVIVVIGAVLIATAGANAMVGRRNRYDALARHERALAALRDLSEHPHPLPSEPPPPPPLTDHVRILSEPPAGAARRRRAQRSPAARRRPRDVADRPTAALLPTRVHASTIPAPTIPTAIPVPSPDPDPSRARTPASDLPDAARRAANRSRALALAAAVTVVLIAAGTAAFVAGRSGGSPRRAAPPPARRAPATTAPAPPVAFTPPARPAAQFVKSAGGNGTITVTVPFSLTLAPTGLCWVSVQTEAGRTLYEGTLDSGQRQRVTGTGPLVVRLGNSPAMQLQVNGVPVNLAGAARTANVRFVAPA